MRQAALAVINRHPIEILKSVNHITPQFFNKSASLSIHLPFFTSGQVVKTHNGVQHTLCG